VQFDLEPPAVRRLFGIPAGELSERTISLDDLMGPDAARLADRLHATDDPSVRFAVLDEVLLGLADRHGSEPPPDLEHAWNLLRASRGTMRIEDLATRVGCSRRHLAKRFAADVGASPKTAARLIRFEAARRRLNQVPLARLAAEHGYADQAHLSREFHELGGVPPTAFPSLQDDAAAVA
jgi:AraC-like DNA-binding protein